MRHRSWLGSHLAEMLRERGVALALIDYPRMPRMGEVTADFSYIRWLGDRREFPEGHTVFAYANNHYQNHSPSTLERFLELKRGNG